MDKENNYVVGYEFKFSPRGYYITIGGKNLEKNFTDDEVIQIVSDGLQHEHIHEAIYDLFNDETLVKLFDTVEKDFDSHRALSVKFLKSEGLTTWEELIKGNGFQHFLCHYHIEDCFLYYAKINSEKRDIIKRA